MTIRYRTTDLTRWGAGQLDDLPPEHVDENFWTLYVDVQYLMTLPPPAPGIDYFEIEGDQLTVVMEDYTTRGPYTLPVVTLNFRGSWAATTLYLSGDILTHGSSIYVVNVNHTSESTFDPGLAIGGEDVYGFGLTVQGQLPTGGAAGQWLQKISGTDFDVAWVNAPIPIGGTTGQYLRKASNVDYDTEWTDSNFEDGTEVGQHFEWNGTEWVQQQLYPPHIEPDNTFVELEAEHINKFNIMTSTSAVTIGVPLEANFPELAAGQMFHFRQSTFGGLTFLELDGSVTINGVSGFFNATNRRGAVATLYYAGDNVWYLYGLLASGAPEDVPDEYAT